VRPLEEYLQLKSAAEELARRELLGEATFVRSPGNVREWMEPDDEVIKIGLFELIDAFQKILQNIAPEERLDLTAERISVKDRISQLVDRFQEKNSLTFDELFAENSDIEDLIVTFLAILEMVKVNLLRLVQHTQSGVIRMFYQ
jgi:segregation and condensation protein A